MRDAWGERVVSHKEGGVYCASPIISSVLWTPCRISGTNTPRIMYDGHVQQPEEGLTDTGGARGRCSQRISVLTFLSSHVAYPSLFPDWGLCELGWRSTKSPHRHPQHSQTCDTGRTGHMVRQYLMLTHCFNSLPPSLPPWSMLSAYPTQTVSAKTRPSHRPCPCFSRLHKRARRGEKGFEGWIL